MQKLNSEMSGIRKMPAQNTGNRFTKSSIVLTTMAFLTIMPCFFSGCKKQSNPADESDTVAAGKSSGASISSGNIWYDKYVTYEASAGGAHFNNPDAGILGWNEGYILRSYVTLYELTKNTAWLTKLTTHADAIIANATDLGGDGFLDWGTTAYGDGGNYPYLVHDGLITLPMAQFIRLVNQNPGTLSAFNTKATAYRTFIETEIVPKWVTSSSYVGNCWVQLSTSTGYFKEPTTHDTLDDAVFNPLPYNMMGPYAEMLWTMYDVNGNVSYRDKANHMVQYFKNGLTLNGVGYKWWYCNISNPHIEDTSHGNLDVGMAIESFNRGGTIGGTEIQKLSNTLTGIMWNQSTTAPSVKPIIDGTGTATVSGSKLLTAWTGMTQFNATAWTIAAEQFRTGTIGNFNNAFTMAQIMAWDPVKVHNQGFEYKFFSDLTLPARWSRSGGTSSNIRINTADKFSGKNSVSITSATGDGTWQALFQDWKQWKPNTSYTITFNVKTVGVAGARVFIHNATAGAVIGTTHDYDSASWSTQTFTFTTPAAGPSLRIYLENHDISTDGTAYFDNVVIKQTGDAW